MSITKILGKKDVDPSEKLEEVAGIVAKARESYGNTDAEIEVPMVNTTHGVMRFDLLDDDSKVDVLAGRVGSLKAKAAEFVAQTPSANMNRKIEELLANDPYFCNISAGTKWEYI